MSLTPVEIRHTQLRRGFFGYRRSAVDRVMTEIADSFEDVWRERADLHDRVELLQAEVVRNKELEDVLRSTLVSAERAAQTMRENARQEADLMLKEAHAEARSVARTAMVEKERFEADTRRIRSLLRSALDALDAEVVPEQRDDEDTGEGITRIAG
jgi:cell division initiation protein